jgi:hypothetical protein
MGAVVTLRRKTSAGNMSTGSGWYIPGEVFSTEAGKYPKR